MKLIKVVILILFPAILNLQAMHMQYAQKEISENLTRFDDNLLLLTSLQTEGDIKQAKDRLVADFEKIQKNLNAIDVQVGILQKNKGYLQDIRVGLKKT